MQRDMGERSILIINEVMAEWQRWFWINALNIRAVGPEVGPLSIRPGDNSGNSRKKCLQRPPLFHLMTMHGSQTLQHLYIFHSLQKRSHKYQDFEWIIRFYLIQGEGVSLPAYMKTQIVQTLPSRLACWLVASKSLLLSEDSVLICILAKLWSVWLKLNILLCF